MAEVGADTDPDRIDQETVYRLLYDERWPELLEFVHRHRSAVAGDALLSHAVDVFVATFFKRLPDSDPVSLKRELETLFLLHSGRYYRLEAERFEAVVERLVMLHADHPSAAIGYARHCPDNAACAAALERHDLRDEVTHAEEARIRLEKTRAAVEVDHTIPLFRSQQEEIFFMAVRDVFASYFPYPNVALSSLIDFEAIRDELSPRERQFFFRGVVDCVVFDQQDGYRPRYFFELDSPHHDTDARRENDAMKDRILSAAGCSLLRIRPTGGATRRDEFAGMLRDVVR